MKFTLKGLRNTILLICFGLISGGIGFWLGTNKLTIGNSQLLIGKKDVPLKKVEVVNKTIPSDKDLDFALFWQVWNKLEEKFLEKDKIDQQKMFYGAIQGLTASLGDPYTVFLPPNDNDQAKEDLNGSFEGVGIQLGFNEEDRLVVMSPLKGMPAKKAGVMAGDLILHIKDETKGIDEDTLGITLPEAVEKIRGPKGSKVILTLQHEKEDKSYVVEITRGTIVVPSVEVDFINAGNTDLITDGTELAHLKLTRFGELTSEQWDKAVLEIVSKMPDLKGVILDVRGNPGGYLSGSVNLASEFLEKGVIVKQENYKGEVETYSVNRKGRLTNISLIVLIDKGSASASEILAGALKDHQRAKLVGSKSFGKGTIQEAEDLSGGAGLHVTTAKWLTPNGDWIHKKGLEPDFEVEYDPEKPDEDKQLDKGIEILKNI